MDQEKIIEILAEFFRHDTKRIQSAVLIGSFGRGKGTNESDVDVELLLSDEKEDVQEFTNDIMQLFNDSEQALVVKHTLWLPDQRKLAMYHGPRLLLTELYLYCEISDFDKYFLGSRITDLSTCILVDREGIIRQHLQHILTLPYDDRDGLIRSLVASIQYHLESSSSARRRSDAYKFYFLSNIALHELVRLGYVLSGKMEYNYNPPQTAVDSNLTSTMDLDRSGLHLKNLVKFFMKQIDQIERTESTLANRVRDFCQDLLNRDYV